jgi:hypothetical protein
MSQQEPSRTYSNPAHSAIENIMISIFKCVESQDWDGFDKKTQNLVPLMDVLARYNERSSADAEVTGLRGKVDEMNIKMSKIEDKLKLRNSWARMIPLFLVAVAIVFYPLYGMVTHMPPQSLVQYLAPVSGLAGAIIGYWFGQQGERNLSSSGQRPETLESCHRLG